MLELFIKYTGRNLQCFIIASLALSLHSCIFVGGRPYARAYKKKPYDAIIVTGIPYDSADGKWSDIMKMRVYWSLFLYQNGVANNIIYSGAAVYTPYVESKIMAMYGEALGISKKNIFIEDKAEHSAENLYYSYHLGKRLGFKKIAVATDPIQLSLLRTFPRKMNIDVDFIPIVFDKLKVMKMEDVSIEAEKARIEDFVSLVDRETKWKRLMGTLGKNYQKVEEGPLVIRRKKPTLNK
jgi:uncharacterized SAM-binding protein YcdF (DUF218 family)